MIKEGKIGVQEAVSMITITIGNQIFFTAPAVAAQSVGTSVWYMSIISCILSILAFTGIYLLMGKFPDKNISQIYNIVFGRLLGFVFSFIYTFSFIFAAGVLLREFADILKVYVLPMTAISFIMGAFVFVTAIAVFLGLESIGRFARLSAYWCLAGFLILLILAVNKYDVSNLFPLLGYGAGKTIQEGITRSSVYSQVILVAVFAEALQGIKHIKKIGYISLILSGGILSLGLFVLTLLFPYAAFQELTSPMYALARLIKYGAFVQRLDSIFVFLWNNTTFIGISVLFYAAVSMFCKTFSLQDKRPVILPFAVILFTIAMFPRDISSVVENYVNSLRVYAIFLFYIIPLIALIIAAVRQKGVKPSA